MRKKIVKRHYAKTPKHMKETAEIVLGKREPTDFLGLPHVAAGNDPKDKSAATRWNLATDKVINDLMKCYENLPRVEDIVKHEAMHAWIDTSGSVSKDWAARLAMQMDDIAARAEAKTKHDAEIIGWINVALAEQARADSLEAELVIERQRSKENWEMMTEFSQLAKEYHHKLGIRSVYLTREYTDYALKWSEAMFTPRYHGEKT